jgi:PAS domain S-box-containing protein
MNMNWRHSIRGKLTTIIMVTSTAAVLMAFLGFVIQDVFDERKDLDEDLLSFGEMISANSGAALTFGDHKAAQEALTVLATKPSVIAGCIYDERKVPFATYFSDTVLPIPNYRGTADGIVRRKGFVELYRPIMRDGERVGTLYVASDLRQLNARMREDAQVMAVILLVCLAVALILSNRLQGRISDPIVELARVADAVSERKDYSVRATSRVTHSGDEIGNLMRGFNGMLAEIERRDDSLVMVQTNLEKTVARRTEQLTSANEQLLVAKTAAEKIADINEQLARESALILNSANDGIIGVDLDAEPSFLNPAGVRMLGRTLDELRGSSIHKLIHHSRADGASLPEEGCPLGRALLKGEPFTVSDDTFWRSDGTSFPVEYSATPMLDERGKQRGTVMTFRDVTERRAIERLKSEFVSTVSHELRTPLTSIRGALGLLGSGLLGPIAGKGQRMLEIAVSNTDRLVRLINDMLDLERMGSGKVELAHSAVEAPVVMQQASDGLQSIALEAGVRIVVEPATGSLWGDSDRLIQALTNLIGNAIKFSPPNTTVRVSGSANETEFTFCVADEGRGVPQEKLTTIFERFSQVDASDSRDKGGSGLGLAICQSIVTAHGGRIWVEANQPCGSRFQFTIPLAPPVAAIDGVSPSKTILVCCEEASPRMAELLERHGFCVVTATSSLGAAALATNVQPDAILIDDAEACDSRQIVDVLKSAIETRGIPVVVVTAKPAEPYAAAVAACIRKDLTSDDDLIAALNVACASPSILIIEDDSDLVRVMATALHSHGIRIFHAGRGSQAIRLSRQHVPSLIVLDLGLPDMDGFAVVDSLRESSVLAGVPLIVYSAMEVGNADRSRLRLGPTEFLTKSLCSLPDFEGHVIRLFETVTKRNEAEHDAAA